MYQSGNGSGAARQIGAHVNRIQDVMNLDRIIEEAKISCHSEECEPSLWQLCW